MLCDTNITLIFTGKVHFIVFICSSGMIEEGLVFDGGLKEEAEYFFQVSLSSHLRGDILLSCNEEKVGGYKYNFINLEWKSNEGDVQGNIQHGLI